MTRRWLLGGMLLAVCGAGCARTPRPDPHSAELQGAWEVRQIINNGEPVPENELKGMRFMVTGDKLTMSGPDEGPDEFTFKLDPTQEPAAMDLTDARGTMLAIYKLDGDTLTIALPPATAKQRARPTTFEFERGSDLGVMILKRP